MFVSRWSGGRVIGDDPQDPLRWFESTPDLKCSTQSPWVLFYLITFIFESKLFLINYSTQV